MFSRQLITDIAVAYITGQSTLTDLAEKHSIKLPTLLKQSERRGWGKTRAEYLEAKVNKPLLDLAPAPLNGQIHVDLAGPTLAYHSAIESIQRLIARASADAESADDEEGKEKAERRLDRLLERQRIMLRIPSPGRDSNQSKQLPREPGATEV